MILRVKNSAIQKNLGFSYTYLLVDWDKSFLLPDKGVIMDSIPLDSQLYAWNGAPVPPSPGDRNVPKIAG
jgi:hypothetical protein